MSDLLRAVFTDSSGSLKARVAKGAAGSFALKIGSAGLSITGCIA